MKCIAMLRGINVGGKNKIRMPELQAAMNMPEIRHAATLLQSGNLLFSTDEENASVLEQIIMARIADVFGLAVTVIVRSGDQWRDVILGIPWSIDPADAAEHCHVTFLKVFPEPLKAASLEMRQEPGELWTLKGREAFLYCPYGYGRTKLANGVFEKKLEVAATTRNWRTILAADAMLNAAFTGQASHASRRIIS